MRRRVAYQPTMGLANHLSGIGRPVAAEHDGVRGTPYVFIEHR
jgi:hypothetical protein